MEIVRRDGAERDAVRLFANDQFDAWLIGWPAHHWTTPHDHGGSLGVVLVIDGVLVERAISSGGTHRLEAGEHHHRPGRSGPRRRDGGRDCA